ncbi:MAG TPA: DUF1328 family protein [Tepidisphaeraceae bacterium]|jgi:uncharacterized membrane protein YtjA (UPF0391 family)|nr:DUF1328 family protein [Tepidisphaeraceae bacterium]
MSALTQLSSLAAVVATNGGGGLGTMFWLAILFFVIAIIAWALGAGGVAGMSAGVGRMLLFVFLVLAIIFAIIGFI